MLFQQITTHTKTLLGNISWIALPVIFCFAKLISATYVKTGKTKRMQIIIFLKIKTKNTLLN